MVSQVPVLSLHPDSRSVADTNIHLAYGDMNLFCTCGPVETIDGMTGAAAPMPT